MHIDVDYPMVYNYLDILKKYEFTLKRLFRASRPLKNKIPEKFNTYKVLMLKHIRNSSFSLVSKSIFGINDLVIAVTNFFLIYLSKKNIKI
jgi:hypothetical protein